MSDKKVTLQGIEFDLAPVLPLRVGDWRKLEAAGVKLGDASIANMAAVAQHVMKKARPEIADDFVDNLLIEEVTLISKAIQGADDDSVDRPT